MSIRYRCPGCAREGAAKDSSAGAKVACPGCGQMIRIPGGPPRPTTAPSLVTGSVEFRCPGCGKSFHAPGSLAGRKIKCKGCGQGVRVPGEPLTSEAGSRPGREAREDTSSTVDLFGLDDTPSPPRGQAGGSESGAGSDEERLPDRDAFKPMSEAKKKKVVKRADRRNKTMPSYAGAGAGVSLGTVLLVTLFGWRMYRTVNRIKRAAEGDAGIVAAGQISPGRDDPKADAADLDRAMAASVAEPTSAEARAWLDLPNHGLFEMNLDRAKAMVAGFYERGAKRVTVIDTAQVGGGSVSNSVVVELPAEPDRRKACLDWEVHYLGGEDPTVDLGQKYLLITTD